MCLMLSHHCINCNNPTASAASTLCYKEALQSYNLQKSKQDKGGHLLPSCRRVTSMTQFTVCGKCQADIGNCKDVGNSDGITTADRISLGTKVGSTERRRTSENNVMHTYTSCIGEIEDGRQSRVDFNYQ